ncbi:MAG TPA: hypothetical protein VM600_03385, partial [Actinomycetota bacterium]|nr:hypothetical protein [Actinomycetota bacterium]
GGLAVLWLVPAWGKLREGFFKLIGVVIAVQAILAWFVARAPLLSTDVDATGASQGLSATAVVPASARAAVWLLGIFATMTVVWQLLLWLRARDVSRIVGIAAVPVGFAALIAIALDPAARNVPAIGIVQLFAGAMFAGAASDGLLLGHWHLVDRKASREPLARINHFFLISCALVAITVLLGGTGGGEARTDLSPLLGVGVLTVSIAVGLAALCALIAFFIRALIKEDSLQSATGLFYLGVIMGLAAEFAAKVRFF